MGQSDILILIPARMASVRLPGKPLADIGGEPMILILLWLLGAPLALIIILFLLGVGH